ncbi:MAG: L-seryl-tRNA(Sec) selenium transferase [Bryobacterales bacterium]|nr:L-seryl-tRNA(Sec) selenium transferase [Bryobacterales bacterium]
MEIAERLRLLPSVDEVALRLEGSGYPRRVVVSEIRRALADAREQLRGGAANVDIDREVIASLSALRGASLRRVINATGVILHTNLGRAPLAGVSMPEGYSNLEYDLATGRRGKRDAHCGALFERILGKPAIAVNNNAAAVYLVLQELAAGAEVIVSRGQLIEIGDGFRIPDIMRRAGVQLKEVGTTNRTHVDDFRRAISERTRLLLIVHPSNFRIEGFTAQPSREEIAALGGEHGIPVYEDLGSGCLADLAPYGIDEPLVQQSLAAGVNVVSFSGDKLLGGPQAGIIAGDAPLIQRIRRNPMFRVLRLDKLIIASLEATLRHILFEEWDALPSLRMIRLKAEEIRARAEALLAALPGLPAQIVPGKSVIGGGSTPEQSLATWHIAISAPSVAEWERRLRAAEPPVIAMIANERLLLDLRTVFPEEESRLLTVLRSVAAINPPAEGLPG